MIGTKTDIKTESLRSLKVTV